jgi:NAD(P)-dependent dehydrogenase (short-subunit alcohol dehydrogenase family)
MRTVRTLAPVRTPMPVPPAPARRRGVRIFGAGGHPAASVLGAPPGAPVTTTVALLGAAFRPEDNALLLDAVTDAWWHRRRLVLIHLGAGGAALLRSSMAGSRLVGWLCVELPAVPSAAALRIAGRLADSDTTGEVGVDGSGAYTRTWQPFDLPAPWPRSPATRSAVITGGLGGLGVRVAGLLAHHYGLHPVLLDRARPVPGSGAARHLDRLARCRLGVTVRTADITDARAVEAALGGLSLQAVVHCAGVLGPPGDCRPQDLQAAQEVKVAGLRHVLAALDPGRLRHLITFGSVLAEEPPHNLGCYALANELLRRETLRAAAALPGATTVAAQWGVWAGAGMAHQLGVLPQARRAGLVPVALRPGLHALSRLLALPPGAGRARALILRGGDS